MSKYQISLSNHEEDIEQAQIFRGNIFRGGQIDCDALDHRAIHGLVRNQYGQIVCVFRMLTAEGEELENCYSAQFYDLRKIKTRGLKALELGRFCVHPDHQDHDIIRIVWAELTKFVQEQEIDLLFGCSSFHGADADLHTEALTLLKERHLAPKSLMPRIKAPKVFQFAKIFQMRPVNLKAAQLSMPPLLRSYLMMGGYVSDHAVVDHDLDTVHVFTAVEVKNIPKRRIRSFDSLAARA